MVKKKLRRHTHAQYVSLRNNEDRLLGERFTVLLLAASFLGVVWGTADSIDLWGRLAVASTGLVITLLIWRMNFRGAQAADDWRRLAIEEEKELYGPHPNKADLSNGPYGLRVAKDRKRSRSIIELGLRFLGWPGLGRTNALSAFWIPLILAAWWGFAIWYTVHHDFDVAHSHEVTDSTDSEAAQTTPNHPD